MFPDCADLPVSEKKVVYIKSTDKGRQIVIDNWFLPINCLCEYHLTSKIYHRVDNQRLINNHKQRYV